MMNITRRTKGCALSVESFDWLSFVAQWCYLGFIYQLRVVPLPFQGSLRYLTEVGIYFPQYPDHTKATQCAPGSGTIVLVWPTAQRAALRCHAAGVQSF